MNYEQITGVLKIAVPFICAWLAAKGLSGLGDTSVVAAITTAVIALGAAGWSFLAHTDAAKLKAAAAVDPSIKIVVPSAVAAANPSIQAVVNDSNVPNVTPPPLGK